MRLKHLQFRQCLFDILAAGVLLGYCYYIWPYLSQPLWWDEIDYLRQIQETIHNGFWDSLIINYKDPKFFIYNPPFYFLITKLWGNFVNSDLFSMRILHLTFQIATFSLIYDLSKKYKAEFLGISAMLLLMFHKSFFFLSFEILPDSLFGFLLVGFLYTILRPHKFKNRIIANLLCLTRLTGIFFVFFNFLYQVMFERDKPFKDHLINFFSSILGFGIWIFGYIANGYDFLFHPAMQTQLESNFFVRAMSTWQLVFSPEIIAIFGVFLIAGVFVRKNKEALNSKIFYLLITAILYPLFLSLFFYPVWRYLLPCYLLFSLFIVVFFQNHKKIHWGIFLCCLIFAWFQLPLLEKSRSWSDQKTLGYSFVGQGFESSNVRKQITTSISELSNYLDSSKTTSIVSGWPYTNLFSMKNSGYSFYSPQVLPLYLYRGNLKNFISQQDIVLLVVNLMDLNEIKKIVSIVDDLQLTEEHTIEHSIVSAKIYRVKHKVLVDYFLNNSD